MFKVGDIIEVRGREEQKGKIMKIHKLDKQDFYKVEAFGFSRYFAEGEIRLAKLPSVELEVWMTEEELNFICSVFEELDYLLPEHQSKCDKIVSKIKETLKGEL